MIAQVSLSRAGIFSLVSASAEVAAGELRGWTEGRAGSDYGTARSLHNRDRHRRSSVSDGPPPPRHHCRPVGRHAPPLTPGSSRCARGRRGHVTITAFAGSQKAAEQGTPETTSGVDHFHAALTGLKLD